MTKPVVKDRDEKIVLHGDTVEVELRVGSVSTDKLVVYSTLDGAGYLEVNPKICRVSKARPPQVGEQWALCGSTGTVLVTVVGIDGEWAWVRRAGELRMTVAVGALTRAC